MRNRRGPATVSEGRRFSKATRLKAGEGETAWRSSCLPPSQETYLRIETAYFLRRTERMRFILTHNPKIKFKGGSILVESSVAA